MTTVPLTLRRAAPGQVAAGRRPALRTIIGEVLLLAAMLVIYSGARLLAAKDVDAAYDHAGEVLGLERWLHLPDEQHLQTVLLRAEPLVHGANGYYAAAHLPVTGLALLWLFIQRPEYYLWARSALVSATATALAVYLLLPVAPPRMLGSVGFVDTAELYGQSVYGSPDGRTLTNQYAAMPSLHVGWALLIAVVCISASSSRWRWLWLAHPVLTTLVVVSTGNHYWLDGMAGAALVAAALVASRRCPAARRGLLSTESHHGAPTSPTSPTRSTSPTSPTSSTSSAGAGRAR